MSGGKALVSMTGKEVKSSGEAKNPADFLAVEPGPVVVTSCGPSGSDVITSAPWAFDKSSRTRSSPRPTVQLLIPRP